jgi:UbiD family decarboxylase
VNGGVVTTPAVDPAQRLAALADLRTFIELSRQRGELEIVRGADAHLEMGALYELSLRDLYPPVLLFEEIKGYPADRRVVMNVRPSRIFVGDLNLETVKAARGKWATEVAAIPPEVVSDGPILTNVVRGDAVDVRAFPAGYWHEGDGGPYIGTECMVITRDPDSDWVNVGTYRVQVHDERTLTVFIEPRKHGGLHRRKFWDRGEPCPMVVVVGQAPVLGNVAGNPSREGVSELAIAGGLIGRAIRVVRGERTGLPIPADAELAFEGFMSPLEAGSRTEGPFAEWTGYYASDPHPEPELRIETIYHRDAPIVVGQPPAKPTFPGRQYRTDKAAVVWDAMEAAGVPGIAGVWKPLGSGAVFVNVVAIKQLFAGHAKMAGLVGTAAGPNAFFGRITIVVDDDIDITDPSEVMWALATRWDPKTQTDIIDNCWSGALDPRLTPDQRSSGEYTNSRAIIYAVRPFRWKDDFPSVNVVDPAYADEVEKKWAGKLSFLPDAKIR